MSETLKACSSRPTWSSRPERLSSKPPAEMLEKALEQE